MGLLIWNIPEWKVEISIWDGGSSNPIPIDVIFSTFISVFSLVIFLTYISNFLYAKAYPRFYLEVYTSLQGKSLEPAFSFLKHCKGPKVVSEHSNLKHSGLIATCIIWWHNIAGSKIVSNPCILQCDMKLHLPRTKINLVFDLNKLTFLEVEMKDKACVIAEQVLNSELRFQPNNIFQRQKGPQMLEYAHWQHP